MYTLKPNIQRLTILVSLVIWILMVLVIVSCSYDYAKSARVTSPIPATIVQNSLTETPVPATVTPTATTLASPVPAMPTVSPSQTPKPVIFVHAPERWTEVVEKQISELNKAGSNWNWQSTPEINQAVLVLLQGDTGIPAGKIPLALTVPFTTEWEEISLAEAQAFQKNGHSLVEVMEWQQMPANRKALRVDGMLPFQDGYPIQQTWSLKTRSGYESAGHELAAKLQQEILIDPPVHLTAVGDLMLDRGLGYAISQGHKAYPFAAVEKFLSSADITVGNMESAMGDIGQPAQKSYTFRAPPVAAESLAIAGFDIISLANNHAMDYGPEALLQAIDLLGQQGITAIGAGSDSSKAHQPYILKINGLSLAFLGYVNVPVEVAGFDTQSWTATADNPGLAWGEPSAIKNDVTQASQLADLVVVILHSGYEYVEAQSLEQLAAARTAIDAGADIVIGHHAHVLQGVEFYKDGVIVYGLGNFAFEIDGDPSTAILNVWLDKNGVRQIEFIPAIIQFGGQPRPAESWEGQAILRRLYALTRPLNPQ